MSKQRLIKSFTAIDASTMEDFTLAMMANFEDALLNSGAQPGVDYTYTDLLRAASPIVCEQFTSSILSFAKEWD